MAIQSRTVTYHDLQQLRETRHERLELIEGGLFVTPAPSLPHQDILAELYTAFRTSVFEPGLGRVYFAPVDVRLAVTTVVQPDLVVVLNDRIQSATASRVEGAPSLVIEVISSSTSQYDVETKRGIYATHEIPEYWLVDPTTKTITICSNPLHGRFQIETVTTDMAVSATIPGFSVEVAMIFATMATD